MNPPPVVTAPSVRLRDGAWAKDARVVPEETPIAIVVNGTSEAVMMATPADLEDFAYGFALTEGLVASIEEISRLELAETELGIEARLWVSERAQTSLAARRRRRAGPVGCGLCGVESLADAMRPIEPVQSTFRITAEDIQRGMDALAAAQQLNEKTRAIHAAAFYAPGEGVAIVREDVGRHNALDKLVGALKREGRFASNGAILMTSRVSIELIQKVAYIGSSVLAAVSAPTALALRTAEAAGITVCGIVRTNGMEVFTHAERVVMTEAAHAD